MKKAYLSTGIAALILSLASTAQAQSPLTVAAWGDNYHGQTTVPVAAQSGVTAIAAGNHHTVALKNDGSVVAWGYNGCGQVTGTPTIAYPYSATASPVTLGGQVLSGVTAIAAGECHTVALKDDGSVVAWGYNGSVLTLAQSGVTAIAAGWYHTVALKNDGSVLAWGSTDPVPLAAQSGVAAIAAGWNFTVALKDDGSVLAWGNNWYGQTTVPAGLSGVTAIAAGSYHTVALKNDGSVVAWGDNFSGQVTGTPTPFLEPATASPVTLGGQVLSGVTAIAAGRFHTVALKNDGTVVAWGQEGLPESGFVPLSIPEGLSGVTAIAAGQNFTVMLGILTAPIIITQPMSQTAGLWQSASFAVTATGFPLHYQWRKDGVDLAGETSATYSLAFAQTNQAGSYTVVVSNPAGSVTSVPPAVLTVNPASPDGAVVAWGNNYYGQTTVPVAAQSGVTAIAAGGGHTVALKNDGSVVAWGGNYYGQTTVPAGLSGVMAIATGGGCWAEEGGCFGGHIVALKNDGSVVAWGGSSLAGNSAVPLAAQSGVTAIAAGAYHTVALKNDGSVVAWGDNGYGQTTVPVAAQSGVIAIAAGYAHTVALKNDGAVLAWGWNTYQTNVPLAAQRGVTAIAAGYQHIVALKNDGSVVVWGDYGQTNVPLAAQSGVTAIAAGQNHTVALKNDGSVVAWGGNYYGQTTVPAGLSWVTAIAAGSWHTVALIGTGFPPGVTEPGPFRIWRVASGPGGARQLFFTHAAPGSYAVLYRGATVTNITTPVALAFAAGFGSGVFIDVVPLAPPGTIFYRVRQVPVSAPLDLDGDGIDDVYELGHRAFLNPFNPADAALDFDDDGRSNLQEYRDGTDPANPP